jgi:ABC-2 type transport system ATP-binding protein
MRDVIKNLGDRHTVMLSSHILQEVSAVCDRVMIINRGKIVASDTPEKLSDTLTQGNKMQVRVKGGKASIVDALAGYPVIRVAKVDVGREPGTADLVLEGDDGVDIREAIFNCMAKNNLPVLLMKSLDMTLEDIFLQVTSTAPDEEEIATEEVAD